MTAALLSIGDELLIGQVANTNAAWLGQELSAAGLSVVRAVSVGDELDLIAEVVVDLIREADALVCTGGIGPTLDDLTRQALGAAFGRELEQRRELASTIEAYYRNRGRKLPDAAHLMALVPTGFEAIPNPIGVAPGLWLDAPVIAALPGVPHEMKAMFRETVLPRLIELQGEGAAVQRTLVTAGAGESDVLERIGDLGPWLTEGLKLAVLPRYGEVRLRVTALGSTRQEAAGRADAFTEFLRERLGELVFGEGDVGLPEAVGRLLEARGLTLAFAESCTGGAAGAAMTAVAGSSRYFLGGIVSYANEVKVGLLGVDAEVLRAHGAVSEAVAVDMARGARARLGADIGASITGVAGPEGGTQATPVGTVWVACVDDRGEAASRLQFGGDRHTIRRLGVTAAIDLVRRRVEAIGRGE